MIDNKFTKSDLKPGMIVEFRNGKRYLVVCNREECFLLGVRNYCLLDEYTNFLESQIPEFDIMKVFTHELIGRLDFILEDGADEYTLIWERAEPREFTIQEIAKRLGIPVEQLRIKE